MPAPESITAPLEAWFRANARTLPWRTMPRDPYRALVSEAMLQQTQVSRVVPAFERFMARFPGVGDLAAADLDDVLALWSGLGYYRRARHLHAAAGRVMSDHAGSVPGDAEALRGLPGVGRYTAGSIASIAFGRREAIVDGNVRRVLLRVYGQDLDPAEKSTDEWAWAKAAALVNASADPAAFNEGLMELGALVCTPPPSAPACGECPLNGVCIARKEGLQTRIPRPKKPPTPSDVFCVSLLIQDREGRVMLEKRPETGMWAGMWQLPTLEQADGWPSGEMVVGFASMRSASLTAKAKPAGEFVHQTTHRTVRFRVYVAKPSTCLRKTASRQWAALGALSTLGISNAMHKALSVALPRGAANPDTLETP